MRSAILCGVTNRAATFDRSCLVGGCSGPTVVVAQPNAERAASVRRRLLSTCWIASTMISGCSMWML